MTINILSEKNRTLLNEKQVAAKLGVQLQTLRNWRYLNKNISYYKIGRLVKYCPEEIERYLSAQRIIVDL